VLHIDDSEEISMGTLKGKTVLLTGANGGFGRVFIRYLLDEGANLVLTSRDVSSLEDFTGEACRRHPGGSVQAVIRGDLSSPEGCIELHRKCREAAPRVDVLIHNAGVLSYGHFHETPAEEWSRLLQVNLHSPMHLTSLFLPDMIGRGRGHVVFMSSAAGFVPTSYETAYSVSKFGLRGFGMALHGEVSKLGIDVTIVYPTWADTDMLNSPVHGAKKTRRVPSFLIVSPERVVRAAVKGIKRRRLHVYADPFTLAFWWLNKITPLVGRMPTE